MNSNPLLLSLIPLSSAQQKLKAEYLTEKLKKYSLDDIAEWELNSMYALDFSVDTPEHRHYRNLILVHSRHELKKILISAYNVFVTPSIIKSVFPSNGIRIEEGSFLTVIIYLSGRGNLNLDSCFVTVNDDILNSPKRIKDRLVFKVPVVYTTGSYRLSVKLTEDSREETNFESYFEIIESAAPQRDQYWREKQTALKERLTSDKKFRSLLLTDARKAFAEAGVPLSRKVSELLPPSIPEVHSDFFTNVDTNMASQMMGQLNQRVGDALEQRDNERISKVLKRLNITQIVEDDGALAPGAIKTVSKILQDPHALLSDLGVTPTEEENKCIFPAFSKETADAFAEWISLIRKNTPPQTSREKQERLKDVTKQIKSDKALYYDWLTNPGETLRKLYPDASARDLLELPPAISEEEAKARINPGTITSAPPSEKSEHNSSDLVCGFSFALLNKFIDLYFTFSAPGLLPKSVTKVNLPTGFPFPFDAITFEIGVDRPGNLAVVDAPARLVSLTASGNASVTLMNGTTYSVTLALVPQYFIVLKDSKIYLEYNTIDVHLTFLPEIPDADLKASIESFIANEVRTIYPQDEIYLVDQKPVDITIPFADTAVDLHRIHVHDDGDDFSSGELFFGIKIDDEEYLFGQYDINSGQGVEFGRFDSDLDSPVPVVGRQYRLNKGNNSFMVSIRGVDRDLDLLGQDEDDDLGGAFNYHSRNAPGNYALIATKPVIVFETVWDIVGTVLKRLCWLVDVIIWAVNRCGKLLGIRGSITTCSEVIDDVLGWISKPKTVFEKVYTFEYSVSPLSPVSISAMPVDFQIANDSIYVYIDFNIPKISNQKGRTHAIDFVGNTTMGIALSENLLDKVVRAWWKYSPITRTKTSDYDSRWVFAHVDFDHPEVELLPSWWIGPVRPDMLLKLSLSGSAGAQEGFMGTARFGLPDQVYAFSTLKLGPDPANSQNAQLTFHIEQLETWGAPVMEQIILHILGQTEIILALREQKTTQVIKFSKDLRASVGSSDFELHPVALKFNEDEVIANFSLQIAPILRTDPHTLNFMVNNDKTITLINDGNVTLVITSISIDDNFFVLTLPFAAPSMYSPLTIFPKGSKSFQVSVDPMWTGFHQGTLSITSNDLVNTVTLVPLIALDIPIVDVPSGIDFYEGTPGQFFLDDNNQNYGRDEYERTEGFISILLVRNAGHAALEITAMEIDSSLFSFYEEPGFPFSILPQDAREFRLTARTETKRYWGTETLYGVSQHSELKISSNDPDKPFVIVKLDLLRPLPWGGDAPGTGDEEWGRKYIDYYHHDSFDAESASS